jgi:hypothetical protein
VAIILKFPLTIGETPWYQYYSDGWGFNIQPAYNKASSLKKHSRQKVQLLVSCRDKAYPSQ